MLHFACNVFVGFIVYRSVAVATATAGVNCIGLVWVMPDVARTLLGHFQVNLCLSTELDITCETRKDGL